MDPLTYTSPATSSAASGFAVLMPTRSWSTVRVGGCMGVDATAMVSGRGVLARGVQLNASVLTSVVVVPVVERPVAIQVDPV